MVVIEFRPLPEIAVAVAVEPERLDHKVVTVLVVKVVQDIVSL